MKTISRIAAGTSFPFVYMCMRLMSLLNGVRSLFKPPVLHFERPYQGEKILLVALYEQGVPRPDIEMLMATARAQGAYVLAVNTLRFSDPAAWRDLIDCYIEKHNFGRDFSSYKTGFLHLYARGWDATCPRVLMLNDSVYYCSQRTPKFLEDMFGSDREALGATENFEFEHHLGSFCIAIAGRVAAHPRMRRYWQTYRNTDIRPKVIARGEMKLSKTLKRIVASEEHFRALYSVSRFARAVREDPAYLARALVNARASKLVRWPSTGPKDVLWDFKARHTVPAEMNYHPDLDRGGSSLALTNARNDDREHAVVDLDDLIATVRNGLVTDQGKADAAVRELAADKLIATFMRGSHIHQNAAALVDLGLPIVKLDGMYRGMFDTGDVRRICSLLPAHDAAALERLLLSRPYGMHNLRGWKLLLYMHGMT